MRTRVLVELDKDSAWEPGGQTVTIGGREAHKKEESLSRDTLSMFYTIMIIVKKASHGGLVLVR